MKRESKNTDQKNISLIKALFLFVFVAAICYIGYYIIKNVFLVSEEFRDFISDHEIVGALILMIICSVQVIAAFIPGEIIEIAAGYVFGAWIGSAVCLIGITAGSCMAVLLARKYGKRIVALFYSEEKLERLSVLKDRVGRNLLVFILYLIPGTPKDFFTYVIGLTDMSIPTYLLLTCFARYPSILMSCYGGDAIGESRFADAVVIMGITAGLSVFGILVYRIIVKIRKKQINSKARK